MGAIQQVLATYGVVAGSGPTVAPKWDSATSSSPLVLSNSDTRLTLPINNSGIAKTVRGSLALTSGKWYWEIKLVSAIPGSGTTTGNGIVDSTFAYASTNLAGSSTVNSGGYWLSGRLYFNGSFTGPYQLQVPGDVVMFALDIGTGQLWVGLNGNWAGDPAGGTGAAYTSLSTSATYYPASNPWSSDASNAVVVDIQGVTNSTYTAPSGFTPYGQ
jgi:hypothetical protein